MFNFDVKKILPWLPVVATTVLAAVNAIGEKTRDEDIETMKQEIEELKSNKEEA